MTRGFSPLIGASNSLTLHTLQSIQNCTEDIQFRIPLFIINRGYIQGSILNTFISCILKVYSKPESKL